MHTHDTETSTDASIATTPIESASPTVPVVISKRDSSGTVPAEVLLQTNAETRFLATRRLRTTMISTWVAAVIPQLLLTLMT